MGNIKVSGKYTPGSRWGKLYKRTAVILVTITLILNIFGCSSSFCDFYREYVYCHIADACGRMTDWIPFPLGEILMYLGVLLLIIAFISLLTLLFSKFVSIIGKKKTAILSASFRWRYLKACLLLFLFVLLIYTLNWILPIRASEIAFKNVASDRVYMVEELEDLRSFMVEHLNQAAEDVDRDEEGHVIYISGEELDRAVSRAMNALGEEEFPLLKGFYPGNKTALCSAVLEWMDIGGYTYPYTMELTTNRYVTGLYAPMLLAHEESHHKGYYLESEANYLAYRALSASEDLRLQYAAYENIYYYVNNAYVESLLQNMTEEELLAYYQTKPQRSDLVKSDEALAEDEAEEDYRNSISKSAEKLQPAAQAAADKGWETQAKALGKACYDGVVEMLLKYYYE